MPKTVAILGAGVLGRALAFRLSQTTAYSIRIFERESEQYKRSASFVAAGMLSPFCELEHSPKAVARCGLESIEHLKNWQETLGDFYFKTNGSLVVAHHRDRIELERLRSRLSYLGYADVYTVVDQGLFFKEEAHVHPASLLDSLLRHSRQLGAEYVFSTTRCPEALLTDYDIVVDCRGLAAKSDIAGLRAVRGELIEVESHEVSLNYPVRLMHPRYPIYVVPQPNHRFAIGATQIESDRMDPMTLRSAAELISSAITVHPTFCEATLVDMRVQCRPAFADHLPRIQVKQQMIQVNGLYRHGYLFTPYIVEYLVQYLQTQHTGEEITCLNIF